MKLSQLRLANFQGVKDLMLDLDPMETRIYGDNATGKTTIANALSWLLYDKASTGEKGFSPKTIGPEGEVHGLNHEVVGVFKGPNGDKEFKKAFYEKYTKVRGRAEKEFTGHTTDYAINGTPVKKKEYDEEVEMTFGDPEQIQILTNPQHFPEGLDWQRRREILLEVCGDVDPGTVLDSLGTEAGLLKAKLETQSIEEITKQAKAKKSALNKELETLPGRIDEAKRAIPDVTLTGTEKRDLERLEEEAQHMRDSISAFEANPREVLKKEMQKARDEEAKGRLAFDNKLLLANAKTLEELESFRDQYRAEALKEKEALNKAEIIRERIKGIEDQREKLLERFTQAQAEAFAEPDACPTCGQALPQEAMEEARASFNEAKSKKLESINQQGQEFSTTRIATMQGEADEWMDIARTHGQAKEELQALAENLKKTLAQGSYEESEDYQRSQKRIASIEANIADLEKEAEKRRAGIKQDLLDNKARQDAIQDLLSKSRVAQAQSERIKELEAERKNASVAYEQAEAILHACETYTRKRAELLDEKINKEFKTVRFKLTEGQVNGGTKDICEVLVPSPGGSLVGFGSANNAARINAGLEIIERLAKHWGKEVPVFIDNAESVTRLQDTSLQTIQLYVSEADKELRIEKGETR